MPAIVETTDANRVEAVERALSLFQCFQLPGEALSLAVLAQRSALYKSTILRLTGSLIRKGFLHRDGNGLFVLGPELRRLGGLSCAPVDLAELIRPVLAVLVARSQETASFYVRDGDARICLVRHNSPRSARHHLDEGARHPLDRGAAGSVLRAFAGAPAKMATTKAAVTVRRQGWAVSLGGREPDLAAVAVPLFNGAGELLGALTVSGLISRFSAETVQEYRHALLEQAEALAPRLPLLDRLHAATADQA
jgi:DNA-binding IclR family transcriptional regulator